MAAGDADGHLPVNHEADSAEHLFSCRWAPLGIMRGPAPPMFRHRACLYLAAVSHRHFTSRDDSGKYAAVGLRLVTAMPYCTRAVILDRRLSSCPDASTARS